MLNSAPSGGVWARNRVAYITGASTRTHMIDLNLAASYVPVCFTVAKITLLGGALSALHQFGLPAFNAHCAVAAVLFLDHAARREYLFSSNALTGLVFAATVFNGGRAARGDGEQLVTRGKETLGVLLSAAWALASLAALYRPETRFPALRYVTPPPLAAGALFLVLHSFVYQAPEMEGHTLLRAFNFAALSIAWIYLIHVRELSPGTVYGCADCAPYFFHVLCVPFPVACVSTVAASALLLSLRTEHAATATVHYTDRDPETGPVPDTAPPPSPPPLSPGAERRQLEALFQEAKARAGGVRMRL